MGALKLALVLLAAGLLLALAACGESDEEKAKGDVCDARDDIQKQVKDLQNLTLGTATLDQIRSNLTAIQDDVKKIADAQGNLSESDREQVGRRTTPSSRSCRTWPARWAAACRSRTPHSS